MIFGSRVCSVCILPTLMTELKSIVSQDGGYITVPYRIVTPIPRQGQGTLQLKPHIGLKRKDGIGSHFSSLPPAVFSSNLLEITVTITTSVQNLQ